MSRKKRKDLEQAYFWIHEIIDDCRIVGIRAERLKEAWEEELLFWGKNSAGNWDICDQEGTLILALNFNDSSRSYVEQSIMVDQMSRGEWG